MYYFKLTKRSCYLFEVEVFPIGSLILTSYIEPFGQIAQFSNVILNSKEGRFVRKEEVSKKILFKTLDDVSKYIRKNKMISYVLESVFESWHNSWDENDN